jgi:hypothetical protein
MVPSVLGADYARLGHEVAELEAAGVDRTGRPAGVAQLRRSLQPDVEARRD